jgi:thiosulfate reductase cytochrome b subunit
LAFPTTGNLINHEIALGHVTIQPAWVRITHWINALAVVLMVMSGWQVYDASLIFPLLRFPSAITLGGWLAPELRRLAGWIVDSLAQTVLSRCLHVAGSAATIAVMKRTARA